MRTRAFDAKGDYRFGGINQWLVDTPEAVAQAIETRLKLETGEWFLDLDAGTDYAGSILGYNTRGTRDLELKQRIVSTPGVKEMTQYASQLDDRTRAFSVTATVTTLYGEATVEVTN